MKFKIKNSKLKIKIIQKDKKILVTFESGKSVDNYVIDKAEDFLSALDRFIRKRKIGPIGQIGPIEFVNTGLLTERIIRAIIIGLRF